MAERASSSSYRLAQIQKRADWTPGEKLEQIPWSAAANSPHGITNLKEIRDPIKILVVEDDPDLGDTLCETLTMSGYRVAHAVDGIAALEMLRKGDNLPDLILLDLMLPRLDGWGFREAQLDDKRLKDIPVVVLSAVGEIVKPINADHLLRKPVSSERLLAMIERFRRRRPV